MKCRLLAVVFLAVAMPAQIGAEMFGPNYRPCGDAPSTLAILACVQEKAETADRRLNAAYRALRERIDPAQSQKLREAQRLWIRYRDANCAFYAAQEGSIGRVQAAECLRAMTEDRAQELEAAMTFE